MNQYNSPVTITFLNLPKNVLETAPSHQQHLVGMQNRNSFQFW